MKREVAGPVPFSMSIAWSVREETWHAAEVALLADCSHCFCHCAGASVWEVAVLVSNEQEPKVGFLQNWISKS